jgi:DNA-binding CsgD family transcriptional regulator
LADAGVEEASSLEGQYNAKEVLQHIVSVLKEAQFTEVEIQTVVEGIREGASQKEIAIAIGRTPQGFNFHWKKFKLAA